MINSFSTYLDQYGSLSEEAELSVERISHPTHLPGNHEILKQGNTLKSIYLILSGSARMYYYHDGREITNQFFFEGEVIADMESIYSGKRSNYTIQLLEDCSLIEMRYSDLEKLFQQFHDQEAIGRKLAIACYLEENQRNRSYQKNTAKGRYFDLLKTYPDILNRVNLSHISSYIGVTQVQLSRIRSKIAAF